MLTPRVMIQRSGIAGFDLAMAELPALRYRRRPKIICMSDEAPKSAYELAMERLRRKDAESGVEELLLTEDQRQEIAEIRRVYAAKIAEAEILHKSQMMTVWEPEERAKREQGHRRDLDRFREDQERKLQAVRNRGGR